MLASPPGSDEAPPEPLFLVTLSLPASDLQADWRRCNMTANYLAAYVAYQFAEREWAENLLSTVANEILEAVAHLSPPAEALDLRCLQRPDALLLEVDHAVRPELAPLYQGFLAELCSRDIAQLYFELLTAAQRPAAPFNQFGLAMVVHDFKAQVATVAHPGTGRLSLQIRLPNQEITG